MSEEKPEKPKFGIWEQLKTIFSGEIDMPSLKSFLRKPKSALFSTRLQIGSVLMSKRLPQRNEDGSVNWPNFFAACMQVSAPIKRSDVFPDDTNGLTENEIWERLSDFVGQRSVKVNYSPNVTAYDPVEFPEVIGPSMRECSSKINSLPFARTVHSFTGSPRQYSRTSLEITVDWQNPNSKVFLEDLQKLCRQYKKDNLKPRFELIREPVEGIADIKITLSMASPADWKENELPPGTLDSNEYLRKLITGDPSKKYNKQMYDQAEKDGKIEQWENYLIEYQHKKNDYSVSNQCKTIYENFWADVGKIADRYKKSS